MGKILYLSERMHLRSGQKKPQRTLRKEDLLVQREPGIPKRKRAERILKNEDVDNTDETLRRV